MRHSHIMPGQWPHRTQKPLAPLLRTLVLSLARKVLQARATVAASRAAPQSSTVPSMHGATSPPIQVPSASRRTWTRPARPIAAPCAAT